ncbi:hypothetical protein Mgra_00004981 [Meloidogyne graminicola]|uniref:Uncharacterized protein n=1 Tax=Meloidogyne graminicola TaxID=189291 RepID=A0A8S9ZQS8_9BILA|nr:hypothetical protein Mgra_00004981 [Meloidogyne graminicola]
MITSNSNGAIQFSLRNDGQNELMGMIPTENILNNHRLAFSSFESEMPNIVRTTNKPVVLTASEQKYNKSSEIKGENNEGACTVGVRHLQLKN